jgi:hypothetical protein
VDGEPMWADDACQFVHWLQEVELFVEELAVKILHVVGDLMDLEMVLRRGLSLWMEVEHLVLQIRGLRDRQAARFR